jgi:hypothetical protein
MKKCRKCGEEKEISSFYKHKKMLDGHLNICIDCVKGRINAHREANLDRIREYDRLRGKTQKRIELSKAYQKTDAGKESHKKALKKYKETYPLRYAAKVIFGNALRDGVVLRQPCIICGEKAEGHHPDYSRPLDVVWLCKKHHMDAHKVSR